jgi:predicted methyltransferase
MRHWIWIPLITLGLGASACADEGADGEGSPRDTAASAMAGDSGGNGHGEGEEEEPISTRAQDAARDEGEKPEEVMDRLGIDAGDHVADVIAGGGYYTYLLAERVGSEGMVYATGAEGVARRMAEGDLAGRANIRVVESLKDVPAGTLDAVLVNRAYHLLNAPNGSFFPDLRRALAPDGVVGVIEVRLGSPTGHDMETHRMGEQTVTEEMQAGGFRLVETSDLLANPDDPHTDFMEGQRHLADRMFLIFRMAEGEAAPEGTPAAD